METQGFIANTFLKSGIEQKLGKHWLVKKPNLLLWNLNHREGSRSLVFHPHSSLGLFPIIFLSTLSKPLFTVPKWEAKEDEQKLATQPHLEATSF